ncbi:MAG: glycosyltransferase [Verrucomicrobia bacterium]|nr:glycosyltransferase [Verrucomicrobiota bacterium]
MDASVPFLSVVIAARPDEAQVLAAHAAALLDYPKDKLEILVARGKQPSVQRNHAVRAAQGEWIYFLDDDSVPERANLRRVLDALVQPGCEGVGGPNLCPETAPPLEQSFASVMGNRLAFGPSAARYRAMGSRRESSEKELILCNLILKRDTFLRLGGFDEALYPNEENALMDAILAQGGRLIYDPNFVVSRRPRTTWRAFVNMLMNYGRGRAEQWRSHPTMNSVLNFVPPLFCVYLAAMPLLPSIALWPLAGYLVMVSASAWLTPREPRARWGAIALGLMLTHIAYGLGFWKGLFTRLKAPGDREPIPVVLERITI